jgi:hypothetical protein
MMVPGQPFGLTPQVRELWERTIEQARASYGQFLDMLAQASGVVARTMPLGEVDAGFVGIHQRTIELAKQNAEEYFSFARELTKANNFYELLAIQNRYAMAQLQAFTLQAQELARLIAEATQRI